MQLKPGTKTFNWFDAKNGFDTFKFRLSEYQQYIPKFHNIRITLERILTIKWHSEEFTLFVLLGTS